MQNKQILVGAVAAFLIYEVILAVNGGKWGGKVEAPPATASNEVVAASVTPEPVAQSVTVDPAAVSAVSTEPAPPASPDASSTSAAPVSGVAPSATTEELIGDMLNGWAQAWAERNESAYFGFYAEDFVPPFGDDRKQWETIRSTRLKNSKPIKIALSKPVVLMIDATHATVTFIQEFHSGTIKETNPKALLLVNKDGRWQIKEERVVN